MDRKEMKHVHKMDRKTLLPYTKPEVTLMGKVEKHTASLLGNPRDLLGHGLR